MPINLLCNWDIKVSTNKFYPKTDEHFSPSIYWEFALNLRNILTKNSKNVSCKMLFIHDLQRLKVISLQFFSSVLETFTIFVIQSFIVQFKVIFGLLKINPEGL